MFKIALVSNTDFSLYNFRMGLIRALMAEGYDVHIICPDGDYVQEFVKLGLRHHTVFVDRKGTNPISDIGTIWQLYTIFKNEKFDLVHNFTIKLNIYGNIAARFAGIPIIVNSVTGLGYVFTKGGIRKKLLRRLVMLLYWLAFNFSKRVIFLNEDDMEILLRNRLVNAPKAVLIKSEGVDTKKFCSSNLCQETLQRVRCELEMPERQWQTIITLISRLIWDKGIREFIEAANILKPKYPNSLFLLVGPIDTGNPVPVSRYYLEQAVRSGLIKYLGERREVPEILYISDVVTLPSYREGIPMVLLEAMCMGKPIVTTNSVGCKEVVEEGKNGFLVPVKDSVALASAIEKLINNEELRVRMGKYGREKVLREFDERVIVNKMLSLYEEILANRVTKNG
jgi:N,N'-diacetylbacillosaminyl-diphospho-undecaprenol alpha-1,3-N-acetylgalactosaminyltransferase